MTMLEGKVWETCLRTSIRVSGMGREFVFRQLTTTTFAPSLASLRAIALPIPREAPVMRATLPSRGLVEDDMLDIWSFLEMVEIMKVATFLKTDRENAKFRGRYKAKR